MTKTKNDLPEITIIMPTFNQVEYIQKAIKSVVTQAYPNFKLFIKDGKSTDGSVDVIKSFAKQYPKKIRWVSSKDKGQADAINFALKRTNSEIVSYLNSDDILKPGALRVVGKFFKNNPDKIWMVGKCDIINVNDKPIRSLITSYKNFWLERYSLKVLLVLNFISQMGVFWKKSAVKKIGMFNAKEHYVMDYDYWLRLAQIDNPGVVDKYLASFRITKSSKSSLGFIDQFRDEYRIAKKHTKSNILPKLHLIHNQLIISIYNLMKFQIKLIFT